MRYFVCVMCALFMVATIEPSTAQELEKVGTIRVKIAVVSIQEVQRKAAAVKDLRAQVETYRAAYQIEIQKEEEALRTTNQELGRQRAILSPEAFAEERRKFEKRLADMQRKVQQRKQDLTKVLNNATFEVQKVINGIIVDLIKKHNLTLVLRKDQTIFVVEPLNMTDAVLKLLDERLPMIKVAEPGK